MSSGLVSVIIPVYNVDQYIRECLESLLAQTYAHFEALIVNDGSTDESGDIAESFAETDSRFTVWNTGNEGIGAARNLAMQAANGSYCFFLDPDDVIAPGTLEYLVETIEATAADIVLGVSENFIGSANFAPSAPDISIFDGKDAISESTLFAKSDMRPLHEKFSSSSANFEFFSCLYRMSLLQKFNIEFLPISYGEDTYVLLSYLLHSSRAVLTSRTTYWHRRNPTSVTFQWHQDYLKQTHLYYAYYSSLFARHLPEQFERAISGLDAQYFLRCLSVIDRELFLGSHNRTLAEAMLTLRELRSDNKFNGLLTLQNIGYLPNRRYRVVLRLLKFRQYSLIGGIVWVIRLRRDRWPQA